VTTLSGFAPHFKAIATIVLILLTLGVATQARAQQTGDYQDIDLPRQPLQEALTAVGKSYGLTVVAPGALVSDKTAPAVSGRFTADQAVNKLLQDSGLEAQRNASGAIVVQQKQSPAADAAAPAEKAAEVSMQLDPVVVTGERSERTLHETASSAAVITSEELNSNPAAREVDDILNYIPNVDLGGNSNEGPTIRGVKAGGPLSGVYSFFGGSRPRATITMDGRAISPDEFIFGSSSLWDVERVEVFRGPQTTAQGANSIAGAIHVITEDPSFETEGKIRVEGGDYRYGRASAAVSTPLVEDELAIRLSADMLRRDSFIDIEPTQDYGPDPDTFLNGVLRAKALWEPYALPELKMKFTFNSARYEMPQAEYVKTDSLEDLTAISTNLPSRRILVDTGIHDLTYAFSDNVEFSNRFSYARINSKRYVDVESSGRATIDKDELSNESTLHWKNDGLALSGLVGAFYQYGNSDEYLNYVLAGKGNFDDVQTGLGLFTEITYDITDRLDLTVGLRYETDRQDRTGSTVGGRLYNVDLDYDESFDAFLPKISLGYDISDEYRVGALVSRGFNPGGVTVLWSNGATNYFDEEYVWNYELFARAMCMDNRLTLNANLFYMDYADYQLNYYAGTYGTSVVYGIANAEKAESYGLELSADYLATDRLRLNAGLGLLHTEIKQFDKAGGIDAEGAAFMRSPDVTLSLGADYDVFEGFTVGGRVRYVGEYKSEDTNDSLSAGDYTVCDVKASYEYGPFTVYGYVNNLFDEFYTISELAIGRAIVGNPREFGAGVQYSF